MSILWSYLRITLMIVLLFNTIRLRRAADLESLADNDDNDNDNNVNNTQTQPITEIPLTTMMTTAATGGGTKETTKMIAENQMPKTCVKDKKIKKQPTRTESSYLKKCCALGEGLDVAEHKEEEYKYNSMCQPTDLRFQPTVINAVLYKNCIEDNEADAETTRLPYRYGNICDTLSDYSSLLHRDKDAELLYVLQDGTLLIMDEYRNETYAIFEHYCMDIDKSTGATYAIVCTSITQFDEHVTRCAALILITTLLSSMVCLLIVSYVHVSLRPLRTLHGLSLSVMSMCLALAHFAHGVTHLYGIPPDSFIGFVLQYFILAYYFWYFCLCCNVLLNVWYKLARNVQFSKRLCCINFGFYCLFAFGLSALLVHMTIKAGLRGTPSYFILGQAAPKRASQRYFIPSISALLGLSFFVLVGCFFGFQRIQRNLTYLPAAKDEPLVVPVTKQFDQQKFEEVKKDAKCITIVGIVLVSTWLLEVVLFYSSGHEYWQLLCDFLIGSQGVYVLLAVLIVRRRRIIILRWWYDRGSHAIEGTELNVITK